jgi:hypothetical protein
LEGLSPSPRAPIPRRMGLDLLWWAVAIAGGFAFLILALFISQWIALLHGRPRGDGGEP